MAIGPEESWEQQLGCPSPIKLESEGASWQDWRWQMRHTIRTLAELERRGLLSPQEVAALRQGGRDTFAIGITPYYARLIDANDPQCPIRRSVVPSALEFAVNPTEQADPLAEDQYRPASAIVHRYRNRCLFMLTGRCATYCRYCTRSRLVGNAARYGTNRRNWDEGLSYIANHPEINDVVLSGGDPLTLPDEDLAYVVAGLRAIKHVDLVRIGTKLPMVLPYRITPALIAMLKPLQPIYWSVHISHPKELTPEAMAALTAIADAGMPIGSQTVLLKGVNDNAEVMLSLMRSLLRLRVRPYYLYQCDPIPGSQHLWVSKDQGLSIMAYLKEHIGGYGLPRYVEDLPGEKGKWELRP